MAAVLERIKISPVFSDEGELLYFVGIQADISNRRTVERMKDEFVSVVSHELRTPPQFAVPSVFGEWSPNHPTGKGSTHAGNCSQEH